MEDEKKFRALDYWEQWEAVVADIATRGNKAWLPVICGHLAWGFVEILMWAMLTFHQGHGLVSRGGAKNAIVVCWLGALLGTNGMYQGPLLGEWRLRFTRQRLRVGSPKEALWGAGKRSSFDVGLFVATVGVSFATLFFELTVPYAIVVGLQFITDYSGFCGADGMFHGPLAAILVAGVDRRALRCWLALVYSLCGVAKAAPWFAYIFAQEMTTPPWAAGVGSLRRVFYDGYAPSRLARLCAHASAAVEGLAPLAGLLVDGRFMYLIIAMHAYIVFHLPFADVTLLNALPAYLSWYGFVAVDDRDDPPTPAWLWVFLGVVAAVAVYAQRDTRVCYLYAYRFWAGNWPQGFYVVSREGLARLRDVGRRFGSGGVWLDLFVEEGKMTSWEAKRQALRFLGAAWHGQLCARVLPALMYDDDRNNNNLADLFVLHCMHLNQWLAGTVSNCALRSNAIVAFLKDSNILRPGDLAYVFIQSFPAFGAETTWSVTDVATGDVKSQGTTSTTLCASYRRPSDLSSSFPRPRRRRQKDD